MKKYIGCLLAILFCAVALSGLAMEAECQHDWQDKNTEYCYATLKERECFVCHTIEFVGWEYKDGKCDYQPIPGGKEILYCDHKNVEAKCQKCGDISYIWQDIDNPKECRISSPQATGSDCWCEWVEGVCDVCGQYCRVQNFYDVPKHDMQRTPEKDTEDCFFIIQAYFCPKCENDGYEEIEKEEPEHLKLVVDEAAIEPTCTESGWTESSHCEVCGTMISEKVEIPALGHIDADNDGHCDVCGVDLAPVAPKEEVLPQEEAPLTEEEKEEKKEEVLTEISDAVASLLTEDGAFVDAVVEVEVADDGTVNVVVAPQEIKTEDAEGAVLELTLTDTALNSFVDQSVETITMVSGDAALNLDLNMAVLAEQMEAAQGTSLKLDVESKPEIQDAVQQKIEAEYVPVTGMYSIAVNAESESGLTALNLAGDAMKLRFKADAKDEAVVALFIDANGEVTEIECVWNEELGCWEIPYAGEGVYMLAKKAE